jgi:hypothetical protein
MSDAGLGMTGWCSHGRHHRCVSGPPGIVLTGGGTYICPCACHTDSGETS